MLRQQVRVLRHRHLAASARSPALCLFALLSPLLLGVPLYLECNAGLVVARKSKGETRGEGQEGQGREGGIRARETEREGKGMRHMARENAHGESK